MANETTIIMRSVLFQVMSAKSLPEAEIAVKAMCTKDDIAAVTVQVNEWKKLQETD